MPSRITFDCFRTAALLALLVATSLGLTPAASAQTDLSAIAEKFSWREVGPANPGGRITDVEGVESAPHIYYVGTATGGLWKTVNDGVTWEAVFESEVSTSIGDVTVAPSNPDIVWVGTGEANIFRSSMAGAGVYKSMDAGATWEHMGLVDTNTIPRIVIHPTNPDIVYVAATGHEWTWNEERGLYKTTDGGESWEKVLFVDEDTGVVEVAMEANGRVLYAATYQRSRHAWGILNGGPDSGI